MQSSGRDGWPTVGTPDVATVVVPMQQNSLLLAIPFKIREHILSFFSYEEVARLRLVCHDWAKTCDSVLHVAFQRLGSALDRRVLELRTSGNITFKGCLLCKALYLTIVEYRFVKAICWRYLRMVTFNFFAGRMLDLFYHIIRLSHYDKENDMYQRNYIGYTYRRFNDLIKEDAIDELSTLVEMFITFFENKIEPGLYPSPTLIGVKIVDLLDCFLGSNCDLDLTYDSKTCTLHGRYFCPLSGALYSVCDDNPAEKYVSSDQEVNSWLSDMRELARKSNQRFIANMIKDVCEVNMVGHKTRCSLSLFSGTRRCKGRIRTTDGKTIRENYEKNLKPSGSFHSDALCLKIIIRVKFPLWQWPLDLDQVVATSKQEYEKKYENEADLEIEQYFDDLVNWAYPCLIPEEVSKEKISNEEVNKHLWFQSEVYRNDADNTQRDMGGAPYLSQTLLDRLKISFQPSRYRQQRYLSVFGSAPTVLIRDACITYSSDSGDSKKMLQVMLGRVRRLPGCKVVPCCGRIGSRKMIKSRV